MAGAKNPYYEGPVSDHFDGVRFFNPGGVQPKQLRDVLKWQLQGGRERWPKHHPSPFESAKPVARLGKGDCEVTHIGHASFLLQAGGLNILIDPVFSERVSPLSFAGPKRVNAPGIAAGDLPEIDLILITHNHYDHLDLLALKAICAQFDPRIITPLGNDTIIRKAIGAARVDAVDWGDVIEVKGVAIHTEPTHHWSARGVGDRCMALWASFVIETATHRIYHVGDSSFFEGRNFKDAAVRHGAFDLAILPIGAYEPRWFMKDQHMNPLESVEAFRLLGAERAVGHHWGTFQLTNEGIEVPREALVQALDEAGVSQEAFLPLSPGQQIRI
ncbi:MBL fold metallo-hydrolase [Rhodobacteraceae bacterium D3-12]|nr:MBL fold metallo-hydrolase [Rhodobacteraceae bacterium D3-12]